MSFRVGLVGFEPTTSASQTQRAAKLRHSPIQLSTLGRRLSARRVGGVGRSAHRIGWERSWSPDGWMRIPTSLRFPIPRLPQMACGGLCATVEDPRRRTFFLPLKGKVAAARRAGDGWGETASQQHPSLRGFCASPTPSPPAADPPRRQGRGRDIPKLSALGFTLSVVSLAKQDTLREGNSAAGLSCFDPVGRNTVARHSHRRRTWVLRHRLPVILSCLAGVAQW